MSRPLTIYKASAGSGKTFTLATEYIRLVVQNPQSYRNILAVTFTNRATEEMKQRILSQLYGIWRQLPESDKYLKAVVRSTGYTEDLIRERAGMALQNLISHYTDFRVMTIDTFFQGVLRHLARELDLTANLRIGLNDSQVEELAVDEIIAELSTTDLMLQWLMRYILENISDDKSWNVIGQVKQFGRTIFKDEYKAVATQLQQKLEQPGFFDAYTSQLRDIRKDSQNHMKEIAESFFDALEGEGLSIDNFPFGRSGICGFFMKLREGVFDESIVGKRVLDALDDPGKWVKKTSPQRAVIEELVESTLGQLLQYAINERPRQYRLYKSADLTLRHLNQLRLLGSIERKVRSLNEEACRFLLSDTQHLLNALIDGSDTPFIFEKMGTQLDHVMIDEFQDTSTVQWQNFRILLSEAMSREMSGSLIVGDVKQSIYRWRSGDWQLLNNIESQFPHPEEQLEVRNLSCNYRSARRIIEFNNEFFTLAAQIEHESLGCSPEAEQLCKAYADVRQEIPVDRPDDGEVEIHLLPSGDDYQEETLQRLTKRVETLTRQGVHPAEMAILVRTNALIPLIAQYFMQHLPEVSIVSDEAFRLDASTAVSLIIEAMRLLWHPDDLLTKASVVQLYQRQVLGSDASDIELLSGDGLLPEAFISDFDHLRQTPLYELAERLYVVFGLTRLQQQSAYICAFFDVLSDYLQDHLSMPQGSVTNASHIGIFLNEWDDTLCGKTIQSDEISGIRLISIHKSKGLEFDHVMIPFCDWQLERQGNILWCQPHETPFDALPLAPIDYNSKQLLGTIYEADYHHEHLQTTVDNLNLLYVAFTRASRSLFVLGKQEARNSRSTLIAEALSRLTNELPCYDYHTAAEHSLFTQPSITASPPPTFQNPFTAPSKPLRIHIDSYPSHVEFRQSNRSRAFIEGDNETTGYIQEGCVLHEIFSTIRTVDDIPQALKRLQLEGVHCSEKTIRRCLDDPRVAPWFDGHYLLYNECTILSRHNGQLLERRPDRVMTDGARWIVVDFKFAAPRPEHQSQVREYIELLRQMVPGAPIEGYLWYVYTRKIIAL